MNGGKKREILFVKDGPLAFFGQTANLAEILDVIGQLRCSMYDNALLPIALANKLVSLSDFPSARILEAFARSAVTRSA